MTFSIELRLLAALLAACCWTDVRTGRLPNALTIGGALLGVATQAALHGTTGLGRSLVGWLLTMGLMLAIYAALGMGGGDAKLIAAVGAFTSLEFAVRTLFHTLVLGLAVAVPVLLARRRLGAVLSRSFWTGTLLMQGQTPDPAPGPEPGDSPFPVAALVLGGAILTWYQPAWSSFLLGGGLS